MSEKQDDLPEISEDAWGILKNIATGGLNLDKKQGIRSQYTDRYERMMNIIDAKDSKAMWGLRHELASTGFEILARSIGMIMDNVTS